ncbi:MAG: hypothetical protein J5778_10895 [Clostridiales bacterium]|nr:hypothetical protein [Clostridiales bacterium]
MRWYEQEGKESDVVIMTTAVVSRSLNGTPFLPKMTKEDYDHVKEAVAGAMEGVSMEKMEGGKIDLARMEELTRDRVLMNEGSQLSENSVIYTDENRSLNVFVNFNEHFTVEARSSGLDLSVTDRAESFASMLESKLDISFSEKYGFLNSNLGDTGTGLRIFALVSIPAICKNDRGAEIIADRCKRYDWKLAAPFRRAGAAGIFFVMSNAMLGVSESSITENGRLLLDEIITIERKCREEIVKSNPAMYEDLYARAYGTLKYATVQQPQEILGNLSNIRLYKDVSSKLAKEGDDGKYELPCDISWKTINVITGDICHECMGDKSGSKTLLSANRKRAKQIKEYLKGDD